MMEAEGFNDVEGVDLCADEIKFARSNVRGRVYCTDVLEYLRSVKSQSIDFITALNFLEHLDKDKLLQILTEAGRALRPGGTLVAMVPNAISPFGGMTRHWDITHEWAFVPNNLRQLAVLTGFKPTVEFRECGPIPHGLKSSIRYAAWQGIRILIAAYLLIEVADTKGGVYTMDMMLRLTTPAGGDCG
jgi:SAM-dependent methyltransferase